MTVLHPQGSTPIGLARLEELGIPVRSFSTDAVARLAPGNAGDVCLIPAVFLNRPEWPRLRVRLAQSNRLFVVELVRPDSATIVHAMRDGAYDVLALSDEEDRWDEVLERTADSQALWLELYSGHLTNESGLVGRSAAMTSLREQIERIGKTDVSVFLLGESGVGKERFATAIHEAGKGGPLVTLNCAAMPKELIEAELFGAEKGSYTGALKTRVGLVEQADGGTLFLDEVGEMDISLQPKLLRFLETRRARRVGGDQEFSVRLRVVAATNREPESEIQLGRFRADLYYRLAEVVMRIPPLRERLDDIPALAQAFVEGASQRFGKNVESLEPKLVAKLQRYWWPGNVRELKSAVDRLVLFHDGPVLREGWWDAPVAAQPMQMGPVPTQLEAATTGTTPEPSLPSRSGRMTLAKQLLSEGKLSLADIAARTGVHPTTLFRWRKSGKV